MTLGDDTITLDPESWYSCGYRQVFRRSLGRLSCYADRGFPWISSVPSRIFQCRYINVIRLSVNVYQSSYYEQ